MCTQLKKEHVSTVQNLSSPQSLSKKHAWAGAWASMHATASSVIRSQARAALRAGWSTAKDEPVEKCPGARKRRSRPRAGFGLAIVKALFMRAAAR